MIIEASNSIFTVGLGLSEKEYLEAVKETFKDDEDKCVKFLEVYKNLTYKQREMIRAIKPDALVDKSDKVGFIYYIHVSEEVSDEFINTVNNIKEKMNE
jgi:hypothetical protein